MAKNKINYKPRILDEYFNKARKSYPVVLVMGARQVGKSTLLSWLSDNKRSYIQLDNPQILELAQSDPELLLQKYPPPILIDEVQYAPELFRTIKLRVDRDRTPDQFWLTGSQPFHLWKGVSESLAGRVAILSLAGFSLAEERDLGKWKFGNILQTMNNDNFSLFPKPIGIKELYEIIWRGSFPEIVINSRMDWNLFYNSYVETYLQRDLRDLANVGDEMVFFRFLKVVASRSGQLLNFSELAKDTDISPNTAKSWISILKTSGIIEILESYHTSKLKRVIKAPKLYFTDTGLCCYLAGWTDPHALEIGAFSGAILETWAYNEIRKSFRNMGREVNLSFYRDKDKNEIDFLIEENGNLYPIEIKRSASPKKSDLHIPASLSKGKQSIGKRLILSFVDNYYPLDKDTITLPLSWIGVR